MSPQLIPRSTPGRGHRLAGAEEAVTHEPDGSPASRSKTVPGRRDAKDAALNEQQEHAVGKEEAGRQAGLRFFLRFWSW